MPAIHGFARAAGINDFVHGRILCPFLRRAMKKFIGRETGGKNRRTVETLAL
jgi:hypothetical protein